MSVTYLNDFKGDFVVGHGYDFVRDIAFLELELLSALHVKTEETRWEDHSVFEVPLDLSLDRVTDKTLSGLVCDCHSDKTKYRCKSKLSIESF